MLLPVCYLSSRVGRVGRADHLGLAISLVSTVPEKVWFCTVKGYKPWLEPDARNTLTKDHGGHTIWWVGEASCASNCVGMLSRLKVSVVSSLCTLFPTPSRSQLTSSPAFVKECFCPFCSSDQCHSSKPINRMASVMAGRCRAQVVINNLPIAARFRGSYS